MRLFKLKGSLLIVLGLLLGVTCTGIPTVTPAPTKVPLVYLPQDDSSHPVKTEWWYYNGHLTAEDGARYGFHLAIFEVIPPAGGPLVHIAHFAITDHQLRTYTTDQRLVLALSELPLEGFRTSVGTWSVSGSGGTDALVASAGEYKLQLRLSSSKPAALHDEDGLVEIPQAGSSFYYSRTRMSTSGTLIKEGRRHQVVGEAWMDHQWGDFVPSVIGWDWFSLQLDDDTEIMLSIVRDKAGKVIHKYGTFVLANGRFTHLGPNDFQVKATGSWTSPHTGVTYPSGWRVSLPNTDISLTLTPVIQEAEFDSRATTQNIYWEGEVTAQGEKRGQPLSAVGFVELVGY